MQNKQSIDYPKMNDAPVFTPTMEEFKDFSAYLQSIEPLCKDVGICKIIPPKEWNGDWEYDIDDMDIVIPHPIRCVFLRYGQTFRFNSLNTFIL